MFIFVLLNLLCLILILSKCIWHSESSRNTTARNIDRLFNVPKREIDVILEEQNMFEGDPEHRCSDCEGDYSNNEDDSEDDSQNDSEKSKNTINCDKPKPIDDEDDEDSSDSAVMVDYVEKSKDLISKIKDELEKKND
jgi:hypothetical protein